jgi:hypothetical protein
MSALKTFAIACTLFVVGTEAATSDATLAYDPPEGNVFTKVRVLLCVK